MTDPEQHVLIIGAGTFGLSTAVELLRNGHKNLTLIDPYPVPSPLAAGNDVNKIFQSTVEDVFYSELAYESLKKWQNDPLYRPAFHETGIIYGGTGTDAVKEIEYRKQQLRKAGKDIDELNKPEDFAKLIPIKADLKSLSLDEKGVQDQADNNKDPRFHKWKGYFQKKDCGWTFASLALQNAAKECVKLGAKVVVDQVETLLFDPDGACLGAKTYSGELIYADKTVISAGANSIKLLEFHGQLLAKCWTVGHLQLTPEEAGLLKNSPVVLNLDEGFCFEGDVNDELKFCNEFPGYINIEKIATNCEPVSIPTYRNQIPKEAEQQMRGFLQQVFPKFAQRPFTVSKICWCTDTPDRHFLFGEHPEHSGLILGTGDSGKGFKYMPVVGEYIAKIVKEGSQSLPEDKRKAWAWRPDSAKNRDVYDLQGRLGGTNKIKDLKEVAEWV